jgi:hypothetical protein
MMELNVFVKVWGAAATVSAQGAFSTFFIETGCVPAGQGFNLSRVSFCSHGSGDSLPGTNEEACGLLSAIVDLVLFKMVLRLVSCWWWCCCFCLAEDATTNHRQALQRLVEAGKGNTTA